MRALPNMNVYVPSDSIEARNITEHLCKGKSPGYLRLGRSGEPDITVNSINSHFNQIIDIKKGKDGTILFVGPIGVRVLAAEKMLRNNGINVSVASVPFITALDLDYLRDAAKKGPIITVEEHSFRGGFGSIILETLNSLDIYCKVKVVAAKQTNLSEIGSQTYLQNQNGLDENTIFNAVKACLEG